MITLLFDLDNTLLDDSATKDYYLPKLYQDFSYLIKSDLATFSARWISAIPKYYKQYSEGKLSFEEQRENRIKEVFNNNNLGSSIIQDVLKSFDIHFESSWSLFTGWIDFLSSSKLQRAIVTNGSKYQQNAKIEKLQLKKYFEYIFISEEIGISKPDPLLFQYVCDTLGVVPENCIFIGDSWHYDILASNQFGMKSIWINHTNEVQKEITENIEVFNSINGVIKRLKEIETELNRRKSNFINLNQ